MEIIFSMFFVSLLAYHTYTDIRQLLLYDSVSLALAVLGLARAAYLGELGVAFKSAGVLLAIMLLIYFVSRGGMGEGDVKLAPALGLWLTLEEGLLGLLLAFVGGSLVGGVLLLAGKSRRSLLPFGPFLCAGALAAYFWGEQLLGWYWQLVLG